MESSTTSNGATMKAFKYILVFLAGFIAGSIICGEIYDYAKKINLPFFQAFTLYAMQNSEYRELKRLVNTGAPIEVINYQFDRMRRLQAFYGNPLVINNSRKYVDPMMHEIRWYMFLEKAGQEEEAEIHKQRAFEYRKKMGVDPNSSSDLLKWEDFISRVDSKKPSEKTEVEEVEESLNPMLFLDRIPAEYPKTPAAPK